MSLDGALLHCVRNELTNLIGARVDKIYQPSREEIVLSLRQLGSPDRSAKKLIFSANGGSARVCLTNAEFDNPQSPPMFCMLLRKHLGGGRLVDIRQDGLERILYFDFECTNEIGDVVVNTVVAEIMGRHSNVIVVRGGRVVDSIKRVTDEVSSVRRVLPNIEYETPPRAERLSLPDCSSEDVLGALEGRTDRLAKALPDVLEGISPVFARECAFYAAGDVDVPCSELDGERRGRIRAFLGKARAALNGAAEYTLLTDETGKKKDICFVGVGQYGNAMTTERFDTANGLVDEFFSSAGKAERSKQRARDLLKTVTNAYERVSGKLELQKKELAECSEREVFRVCGDLINANIYRLEKGMTKCVLDDFYTGEQREIALDARLTPSQNAQRYYAKYRKLDTAEKMLSEQIRKGADDLVYLDSVLDCLSRSESEQELGEIRRELREQGYVKGGRGKPDELKKKLSEPLKFRSTDGFEILVGRNNRQNDQLTLKTAKATDIWLHTKDIAGSHVIIRTDGKTPSERTLFEAAQLAAYHSKGRNGSGVPVDYTAVKFVRKPAGAKPGMVIFTNNKTLYVTPGEEIPDKLKTK